MEKLLHHASPAPLSSWMVPLLLCLSFYVPSLGQGDYTKADSGWVQLFDGESFDGLYIRTNGGVLQDPDDQNSYEIVDSTIHVLSGVGHLATQAVYMNYQVRVQYKYDTRNNNRNAGLLYHIVEEDYEEGQEYGSDSPAPYYHGGGFVTSIEFQTYQATESGTSHAGAFLGIGNIWGSSEVGDMSQCPYEEGGESFDIVPGGFYCARRVGPAHDGNVEDVDEWVQLQLNAVDDSVEHLVNGEVAFRAWNLSFNTDSPSGEYNDGPKLTYNKGHVGLQTEGAQLSYRNFEIRMLTEEGTPIIPGCTDSLATNYLPIATVDDSTCEVPIGANGTPSQSLLEINSTSIGGTITFNYNLPGLSELPGASLEIFTVGGRRVLTYPLVQSSGSFDWDGTTENGNKVERGTYFIRLNSKDYNTTEKFLLIN